MEKIIIHGENKSTFDKPIAIYARQSVEKENSISIEQQIDYCLNMAKAKEYAGPVFVYADEGFSGKNINRPDFQKMLADVDENKISCIFTYKLDRMSRKLLDYLNLKEDFKEHNVEIHSYSEPELNKNDDLITNILMAFAEQERKNTAARVRDNYFSRTQKRGSWPGGKPPFGFSLGKKDGIPTLIPIAEEIEIVKEIFNIYHDTAGISLGKLAKIIEDKGITGKNGSTFTSVTVGRILRNPIYVKADILLYDYLHKVYFPHGNDNETNEDYNFMSPKEKWDGTHSAMIINKRPSSHNTVRTYTDYKERRAFLTNIEGIIESKTFVEVQEKLAKNKQLCRSNKIGRLQELTGLIKCANCGLAVKTYSHRVTLSCYGRVGLHKCDVKFAETGKTCPEAFEDLRIKIGLCITKYYLHLINAYKEIDEHNKSINKQIEEKEKEMDVLFESFADFEAEAKKRIQLKINNLSREISELRYELSYNSQTNKLIHAKQNLNYFALSTEEKKEILNLLIDKILLYPDYSFEIVWKNKALQDIEDNYPLEFFKNGRIRFKEDKTADMANDKIDQVIYESVGAKIDSIKTICQLKNIDLPDDFFEIYSNSSKEEFISRLNKMSKLLIKHKKDRIQQIYDLAKKYPPKLFDPEEEIAKIKRTTPNSDNFVEEAIRQYTADKKIILSLANKQKRKRKKQAEIINLTNNSDIEFLEKLHERDSWKELKETLETVDFQDVYNIQDEDINYLSTFLLLDGIVEDYDEDITPNERLTLAFALLLPFLDNLDNAHFYDLETYLDIYKLIAT